MIDERAERLHSHANRRVAPVLLKPEEAAEALGISRTQVYRLLAARRIRSMKIGKLRRITPQALRDFVEQGEDLVESK